ncbi:MAG: hypothetical protein QOF48_2163, partial [Verrucomicrobiota bacterium]
MRIRWIPVLLLVALCGCFKTKDELIINADGSGSVRLETRMLVPMEALSALGLGSHGQEDAPVSYPPSTEAEARHWFPAKDFSVTTKMEPGNDGDSLVVTAAFKDINVLLASPYGKAHGLTLKIEGGVLKLQAVLGIEAAARIAEMKDGAGMFGDAMPSMEEMMKKKDEMRAEFRVTLPAAVTTAGASGSRDGHSVTWIADRTRQTNAVEFARQSGALLDAACSAEGLKFKPITPPRLGILSFKDAPGGPLGEQTAGPDPQKVTEAAKFVPYVLQVTRTLDLSGEGGAGQNQAQLIGAIVIPTKWLPQKWGEFKLEEVFDAKGTSLKLPTDENGFSSRRYYGRHNISTEDENEDGAPPPADSTESRHLVTIAFQPPDWTTKEIARIKGAIQLQYFGGSQVVKLSNAIPANWIREMKSETDFDLQPGQKTISDPKLTALGMSMSLTMGVTQGSFT